MKKSGSNFSPGTGHEHHERLAGVATLTDDEMTEIPALRLLVVRIEPLASGPRLHGLADAVPEIGREQALVDVDDLVPATGPVKAEPGAVRAAGEGVLQLVSVPVLRLRGHDRLERWVGEPADPDQRVAHL